MTDPVTKLLLLDFDNVLNDNAFITAVTARFPGQRSFNMEIGRAMLDPVRCARVQRICDATGASILLITGWRRQTEWGNLAELLRDSGITTTVVGAIAGVRMSGETRATAAREWLNQHPEVTRYVIIDDDTFHWGFERKNPWKDVMVAPTDGIEDEHVEQAIAILNRE